ATCEARVAAIHTTDDGTIDEGPVVFRLNGEGAIDVQCFYIEDGGGVGRDDAGVDPFGPIARRRCETGDGAGHARSGHGGGVAKAVIAAGEVIHLGWRAELNRAILSMPPRGRPA